MAKSEVEQVAGWGDVDRESMTFAQMMDAGVIDIAEVDDVIAVDQAELVGVPFVLYSVDVKDSQTYGGTYAVCRVKTMDGTRVFADGGVGIVEQCERYKNRLIDLGLSGFEPLYFHYGLRASTYTKEVNGAQVQATTYYFDNRKRP